MEFEHLMEYLGESSSTKWEEFFGLIHDFVHQWNMEVAALKAAEEKKVSDAKNKKRKDERRKREETRKSGGAGGNDGGTREANKRVGLILI